MDDQRFLDKAELAIQFLDALEAEPYWSGTLPSGEDMRIQQICDLYMQATSEQREVLTSDINRTACYNLGAFSVRMTMLSVRQNSKALLLKGLVALIMEMEWPKIDTREVLMDLSVLYHSAAKLGNPDRLFRRAAQYADKERTRNLLLGYLRRSPENNKIEDMGWKEVEGPSGLIYQYGNQPIPKGFL